MNVVDSSGWMEFFIGGPNAKVFAKPIEEVYTLIVPSIIISEVFKKILEKNNEKTALDIIGHMFQGRMVDLNAELAMSAAKLGRELKLPLADSIIVATARLHHAVLWTQDNDFKNIEGVRYFPK